MKKWVTRTGYEITRVLSGRSNVFLLSAGNRNILIDTSVARNWGKLRKKLSRLNVDTIDYLILTHAHFDHAANAKRIKEKFNSTVIIQKEEESCLSGGTNIVPRGTVLLTRILVKMLEKRFAGKFNYEPCVPDILAGSEYDLRDLGFHASLIHTPGHTRGSMSLVIDDEIAIVGDTMFGVSRRSAFPPFAEDQDLMLKSWGKLLHTSCRLFLPSHGREKNRPSVQEEYDKRMKKLRHLNV